MINQPGKDSLKIGVTGESGTNALVARDASHILKGNLKFLQECFYAYTSS